SLALGQQYSSLGSQPILCGSIPGLVPKQLRFCRNYIEIMPSVAEGVKLGIQECQHQFRGRRWNCTTIDDSLAIFGPVLDKVDKNLHFSPVDCVHSVPHSAQGTSTGDILVSQLCKHNKNQFPLLFLGVDTTGSLQPKISLLHRNCFGNGIFMVQTSRNWRSWSESRTLDSFPSVPAEFRSSGESFLQSPKILQRKSSSYSSFFFFPSFSLPVSRDLVYYENSPNFCEPNPETGSFGTRDRTCNVTSHGIDGCDLLCCGRGHNTRTEKRKEKCHCIFHWCCYVSCQECTRVYDVHTCK
ncbi:WNT3 protein, partial [Calcarius ornatus]|nr:WNT3 protein [Calcarius ornatus]